MQYDKLELQNYFDLFVLKLIRNVTYFCCMHMFLGAYLDQFAQSQ